VAEEKSFKKYEILAIVILTLFFIYTLVYFNQKINFFLGNELIVYLTPNQKSLYINYGNSSRVDFMISIDNAPNCKASCTYSFNDRSRNLILDQGNFQLSNNENEIKNYTLSVKRLGSGQDVYSIDVSCHSIRSFLCLTESGDKFKSSLITVNYDLSEAEKELKKILKQNVTKLLGLLSDVDVKHQRINQKYFELAHKINLKNATKDKIDIDDKYDKVRVSIENLQSLWSTEDYFKLNQLFNASFFEQLNEVALSIGNLDKKIENITLIHNQFVLELYGMSDRLNELAGFVSALEVEQIANTTNGNIKDFNELASSVLNNTFESYDFLDKKIANVKVKNNALFERSKIPAAILFFDILHSINFENDLLCSIKNDCANNISAENIMDSAQDFIDVYPNKAVSENCKSLLSLEEKFLSTREEALKAISGQNIVFPNEKEFFDAAEIFKENEIRKINNSYLDSLKKKGRENKTSQSIIKIAEAVLPKDIMNTTTLDYNQSNLSLYLLSKINASNKTSQLAKKCMKLNESIEKIGDFYFMPISTNVTYKIFQNIGTSLSENPPICCVFNDCKPCCRDDSCRNDPKTFPIIFLHGHSFAKDNSPEFSLDAFNKLQAKLQEDGYLNAGIISLYSRNEPLQKGIWGLSGKPITVKASYYYDAFRKEDKYIVVPTKSENIDTYAIRLKDLIDVVKERTNKPKVNIITHSMGGLVARRYAQIFGAQDVDKMIMIAAPNKGVSRRTASYCGFVGENRECGDMKADSLFINKLNDPSNQPNGIRLYSIIGQGCATDNSDGDGVVAIESARLDNATLFYINGTCDGLESLHTDVLDIDKYPQVYSTITEILTE